MNTPSTEHSLRILHVADNLSACPAETVEADTTPNVKRNTVLSGREQQIMSLLGQGETNSDIAAIFEISVRTVETYYKRIGAKLDLKGMKELRRYAIRNKQFSYSMPETIRDQGMVRC